MRNYLIAGACLVWLSGHARAQGIAVFDDANLLEQVKAVLTQAKQYAQQAQAYGVQVEQYATEIEQLNGFIHDPTLGAAAALLNQTGMSNSLPINPQAVASLAQGGFGGMSSLTGILGKVGQLGSLANSSYATNHIYSPADGSWNSQQLIANGTSIATTQGAAQSIYGDLRNHLPILQALQDRLKTATTPKDVMDAQAAIDNETAWTHNAAASLQAIQVNYQAQNDARVQRDNESISQSFDQFHTTANAMAWPQ